MRNAILGNYPTCKLVISRITLHFVLARLALRPIPNRDGELRMSIKPEPVHYPPKLSCIRNAHGKKFYPSVEVTEADKEVMDDVHIQH